MARVIVFHSALGLRPGVLDAARRLRAAGHEVVTPDLYQGRVFESIEEGIAVRDAIGRSVLLERAATSLEGLAPTVLVGFSLGASLAHELAMSHPEVPAVVLVSGASDEDSPPTRLAVQFHASESDPWIGTDDDIDQWARRLRLAGARVEVHRYPGSGHLFTDPSLPDHDPAATELLWQRVIQFIRPFA